MYAGDSNADDSDEDRSMSLLEIASSLPNKSLISRLMDVQECSIAQKKSLGFIKNLDCLYFSPPKRARDDEQIGPTILRRRKVNGLRGDFVAVSYTWVPSPNFEANTPAGGYSVAPRGPGKPEPSPVRNSVFDRLQRYMEYSGAKNLWIDQHCIEQKPGRERERGMQAMDLVYGRSKYPVALLARPMESLAELALLAQVLEGTLVTEDQQNGSFKLSSNASPQELLQAMELLKAITDDRWWKRGWTFQEKYRSLSKMILLVPHALHLEDKNPYASDSQGSRDKLFGCLRGELCIKSWKFHQEATKLSLAYERQQPVNRGLCQSVIVSAGKYSILLRKRNKYGITFAPKSMTPTIFADIARRDLEKAWDRVAIAANCCQYSVRLDSMRLKDGDHSVSLSMLALYFLNGEFMSNHPDDGLDTERARALNVFEFIEMQSYKRFDAPFSKGHLSFNKTCRFANVEIVEEGIRTKGHLWVVDTYLRAGSLFTDTPSKPPSKRDGRSHVARRLREFVDELDRIGEESIAARLGQFLEDYLDARREKTFTTNWLDSMAENLVLAMDEGKDLGIGHLLGDTASGPARGAIFVLDFEGQNIDEGGNARRSEKVESSISSDSDSDGTEGSGVEDLADEDQIIVFTSFRPEESDLEADLNDTDRYVSIVVGCQDIYERTPRLYTEEWIHGLCFFEGWSPQNVLFPWPRSLIGL